MRWQRVPSELAEMAIRLKDAEIENRPAIDVIRRFATKDTLIYADPPYLMETRTQKMYAHEMSVDEHLEMLAVLQSHPGPAVISGYESSIYDKHLRDWKKILVKPPKVEKQAARMEVLWVKG